MKHQQTSCNSGISDGISDFVVLFFSLLLLLGVGSSTPAAPPASTSTSTQGNLDHGLNGSDKMKFKTLMTAYFKEEQIEAAFFVGVGVAAIVFAVWALLGESRLRKGMAYPFIAIALIQIIVGATVFFRTDGQLAELTALFDKDAAAYLKAELPRMEIVNYWFDVYRWIEIALITGGLLLVLAARPGGRRLMMGVGLGLMLQSGFMLALDFVAEHRADVYTRQIHMIKKIVESRAQGMNTQGKIK